MSRQGGSGVLQAMRLPAVPSRSLAAFRMWLLRCAAASALVLLAGCDPGAAIDRLRPEPRTPYDRYAASLRDAGLDSTALGREWLAASDSAIRAPLAASLPAREVGVYSRSEARAVAYRFSLREGQRLRALFEVEGQPARVYVDLFEATGDSARPFRHRESGSLPSPPAAGTRVELQHEAEETGDYILRLQPELLRGGKFVLTLETEPILAFPVEGGTNRSIQSYFGAVRDGGRRDHHGIDIFARRGTPVIAAADGVVRSIAPNNLGGNVVWLSDGARGQSLYYAHLDRHAVTQGQRVRTGDTVGFVGNTGNARTTAPHLHFGIYRRGRGPVDPLPYVRLPVASVPPLGVDTSRLGSHGTVGVADAGVRAGPGEGSEVLRRLARQTPVQLMGASRGWYRVQLEDGTAGYLAESALRVTRPGDARDFGL
jgi:murein DD-endopeptidase MepM/ murein hydrolase activator NlpD